MKELIDKRKLLSDLKGIKDVLVGAGDPFLAGVLTRAIRCVEDQPEVKTTAEADAAPEMPAPADKKLEKAIRELSEHYDRAQTLGFVHNKLGWALYQTWSKYE